MYKTIHEIIQSYQKLAGTFGLIFLQVHQPIFKTIVSIHCVASSIIIHSSWIRSNRLKFSVEIYSSSFQNFQIPNYRNYTLLRENTAISCYFHGRQAFVNFIFRYSRLLRSFSSLIATSSRKCAATFQAQNTASVVR